MSESITQAVQSKYASVAKSGLSTGHTGVKAVAEAFGYTPEQLASIPAEANMGLSCGNPTAFASLKPGETVVDLGCGGGLDVLLAAAVVGPSGKAIGIDMTPEMLELARRNAARGKDGKPITNVEFHLATIDNLPLPETSVDCVISNCVINLAPDKKAVFLRNRSRTQAGRTVGGERYRTEKAIATGNRQRSHGLCGLYCRGNSHRRVSQAITRSRVCPSGHHRHWKRPERLCESGEPIGLLLPGDGSDVANGFGKLLLLITQRKRRPSSANGRFASPLQRKRFCGQCPRLRREAGLSHSPLWG